MVTKDTKPRSPGVCVPWEEKINEYPKILGDEKIIQKVWEDVDTLAYVYVWSTLTLF